MKDKGSFDWATHGFRGIAILAVMACHFCAMSGYERTNRIFFTGATHFFLFISGYLCRYVFDRKAEHPLTYYRKKITNVISPYLLFTAIFSLTISKNGFLTDLLNGSAQAAYWYIPFVTTLFLISPILCRLNRATMPALFAVAFIASVFIPERQYPLSWQWPKVLHLYTYFVPYYLLGFIYARFRTLSDKLISRLIIPIAVMAILLYVAIAFPQMNFAAIHEDLLVSLQRLTMIALTLWLLRKLPNRRIAALDYLASVSFSLFFTHDIFFHGLLAIIPNGLRNGYFDTVTFAVGSAILTALCLGAKKLLGRFSRPLIGS